MRIGITPMKFTGSYFVCNYSLNTSLYREYSIVIDDHCIAVR